MFNLVLLRLFIHIRRILLYLITKLRILTSFIRRSEISWIFVLFKFKHLNFALLSSPFARFITFLFLIDRKFSSFRLDHFALGKSFDLFHLKLLVFMIKRRTFIVAQLHIPVVGCRGFFNSFFSFELSTGALNRFSATKPRILGNFWWRIQNGLKTLLFLKKRLQILETLFNLFRLNRRILPIINLLLFHFVRFFSFITKLLRRFHRLRRSLIIRLKMNHGRRSVLLTPNLSNLRWRRSLALK